MADNAGGTWDAWLRAFAEPAEETASRETPPLWAPRITAPRFLAVASGVAVAGFAGALLLNVRRHNLRLSLKQRSVRLAVRALLYATAMNASLACAVVGTVRYGLDLRSVRRPREMVPYALTRQPQEVGVWLRGKLKPAGAYLRTKVPGFLPPRYVPDTAGDSSDEADLGTVLDAVKRTMDETDE